MFIFSIPHRSYHLPTVFTTLIPLSPSTEWVVPADGDYGTPIGGGNWSGLMGKLVDGVSVEEGRLLVCVGETVKRRLGRIEGE